MRNYKTVPLVKILSEMTVGENNSTLVAKNTQNKAQDKTQDKAQDKAQDDLIRKIVEFCTEAKNIFEIMENVGYKNRNRFRRDYIKPMVERGLLNMTIPDKPTSRNQKYIAKK